MADEPKRMARIDWAELAEMPPAWTNRERGQYLRLLFRMRGIDPQRLYRIEYYPLRRCWLVTQPADPGRQPAETPDGAKEDELFFGQIVAELRRTALAACAALAAHSPHFARFGGKYQLPAEEEEVTTSDLRGLLGNAGDSNPPVRFDREGGWRAGRSAN